MEMERENSRAQLPAFSCELGLDLQGSAGRWQAGIRTCPAGPRDTTSLALDPSRKNDWRCRGGVGIVRGGVAECPGKAA